MKPTRKFASDFFTYDNLERRCVLSASVLTTPFADADQAFYEAPNYDQSTSLSTISQLEIAVNGDVQTVSSLGALIVNPGDEISVVGISIDSSADIGVFAAEGYLNKLTDDSSASVIDYSDGRFSARVDNFQANGLGGLINGLQDSWVVEEGWDRLTISLVHYTEAGVELTDQFRVSLQVGQADLAFDTSVFDIWAGQTFETGQAIEFSGLWQNFGLGTYHNYAEADVFAASDVNTQTALWAGALVGNAGGPVEGVFLNTRGGDGFDSLFVPEQAGEYIVEFTVDPENSVFESDESNNQYTITITVEDPYRGELLVSDAKVSESDAAAEFTVNLSEASDQEVTVEFATFEETAVAGSDFTAVNGSLTFAPGETSQVISVPVLSDRAFESEESFGVELFNATVATLGADTTGRATLVDSTSLADQLEFYLIDADTNTRLQTIQSGDELLVSSNQNLTFAAYVPEDSLFFGEVESVFLNLNDGQITQQENVEPYSLFGDSDPRFNGGLIPLGENSLTLELYSENRLRGQLLETVSFDFTLVLSGGDGNDVLTGDSGNDHIFGAAGNDIIDGGRGRDVLDGGQGDDTLLAGFDDGTGDVFIGGEGVDTLVIDGTEVERFAFDIDLTAGTDSFGNTFEGIENIVGGQNDDQFVGDDADNVLNGLGGDDVLVGGEGDDTLLGDAGDDVLEGGQGNDVLDGGRGKDKLDGGDGDDILLAGFDDGTGDVFVGGEGVDTHVIDGTEVSRFAFSVDLAAGADNFGNTFDGIENIVGGEGNDRFIGDDADNVLSGSNGDDILSGGDGNDTLVGGEGNNTLTGGEGQDQFVVGQGAGRDVVTDFVIGEDTLLFEGFELSELQEDLQIVDNGNGLVLMFQGASITLAGLTQEEFSWDLFANDDDDE